MKEGKKEAGKRRKKDQKDPSDQASRNSSVGSRSASRKKDPTPSSDGPSPTSKNTPGPNGSLIYLGFEWGMDNINTFMLGYIKGVRDVMGDGHCGYRSIAVLLGYDEGSYIQIRFSFSQFIVLRRDIWSLVLEDMKIVDQLLMEVNTIVSPCARAAWMEVPIMGLVFATLHQVTLVCLTWFGPCTCLPLWAPLGSEPPTTVYAIALIRNRDHFVPVCILTIYKYIFEL